ncbi:mesaconyl-C4 hydratase [Fusarium albosuccineum]|uniref:Mesaconyl-C4 hydratase n=1 Tax=Fusarium albosuccineum TaxID=1237068 RepID=A0A8H4L0A7_9HYPO|nr:mesaconyl-C4 hydratase [Fusarium albosuccineum]
MRLFLRSAPGLGRQCGQFGHRAYSSASSSPKASSSPSSSILSAMEAIKAHPPKIIPDYLSPMPSHLLSTTLTDLLSPSTQSSSSPTIASPPTPLPQGHHLVYFPIQLAPSQLIPDGADPDHSPGSPFTRRVWAGGEVTFSKTWRDMRLDARPAVCREKVEDVSLRGRDGEEKVFVDVWRRYGVGHEVEQRREWDIEERRTLVFMREEEGSSPSPARLIKYPHPSSHSVALTPSPTHLFHFSALSFNAHSIHIDPLYAREVDGHRALLVHGPLTLALMLRVLNDHIGPSACVRRFTYRNYAPLYVDEQMSINLRRVSREDGVEGRWDVWIEGPEGGMAVKGNADVIPLEIELA